MAASQCPSSLARRIEADAQELHLIGSKSELPRTLVGASSANRRVLGCPVLYRSGAPDTIRTCDLCLRRATLYPAELRVRCGADRLSAKPQKRAEKGWLGRGKAL